VIPKPALDVVAGGFRQAAGARKRWTCGCLHSTVAAVGGALHGASEPLAAALADARRVLEPVRYDCLGCEPCYPAEAVAALTGAVPALADAVDPCPTEPVTERSGWPPLPGDYVVLRHGAPVAACTLTDVALAEDLAGSGEDSLSVVGTLQTENLGIERLVRNVVTNPNIRFLLVCGEDSRRAVGHLPGASLLALARHGIDEKGRIREAPGRRPVLKNISAGAVEHFRRSVEVVDLIGVTDRQRLVGAIRAHGALEPPASEPFAAEPLVDSVPGFVPDRTVQDPAGYLVVYVDRRRARLCVEHYTNDGMLDAVIHGRTAAECYHAVIRAGLVSRLDHAAYLGRELARAERALASDEVFVQDAAADRSVENAGRCCAVPKGRAS